MSEEHRKMLKEMIEPTDPYERGFIDGMAKQRDSAVQRFVEGGTPDSELAEHKRIIREQQAEIEQLKKVLKEIIDISDRKHDVWDEAKELLQKERKRVKSNED